MYLSNAFVRRQASAIATIPARPGIIQRGQSDIGYNETVDLSAATLAWHRKVKFFSEEHATGTNTAALMSAAGNMVLTSGSAGTLQVERATCVGTVTAAGTVICTVTSALLGVPVEVPVVVAEGDIAGTWATEVATALAANAEITAYYIVTNPTAGVVALTSIDPYPNDGTLNIAIAAGTATGITAAPTSANTTAGVGGTVITPTVSAEDIFGDGIPTCDLVYIRFIAGGATGVKLEHTAVGNLGWMILPPGACLEIPAQPAAGLFVNFGTGHDFNVYALGEGEVDILCYATEA